ncbi:hypothetical protein [Pseudomonas citronellolis]|uniref:hypothetical protein n=1 Tax=Pseudomonas citronellolis TaxID=53408 RepID=UPI0023E369BC|nr:hypothetical protein [Pseudomonas citronellolis]MDF3934660.1 hypothetical protein [Pseudomonas citronellolis]
MAKEERDTVHLGEPGATSESGSKIAGVRFCEGQPLVDVLRTIKLGGSEWASRYVKLCFSGAANGWVLLYPSQCSDAPYFDFMYSANEAPQQVLAAMFEKYPQCSVIDWSSGRLASLEAPGVDVELLADIIQEVASVVWDERSRLVDAWYEEMGRA